MTRIQLLAVDVDGTLVTSEDEISAPTRAALHGLRGAGVEVAIATGRRFRKAKGAIDALGIEVPSICLGGTLVKGEDGRTLHAQAFEVSQFRTVASLFRSCGHAVVAQRDSDRDGGADFLLDESVPWNPPTRDYHERNAEFAEPVERLPDQARDDVLVVGTFGALTELQRLERELYRVHREAFTAHVMPGFFNQGYYIGLEDDYDLGAKLTLDRKPYTLQFAYYLRDEGNYYGDSIDSARYLPVLINSS